jgi:hypothetical protein
VPGDVWQAGPNPLGKAPSKSTSRHVAVVAGAVLAVVASLVALSLYGLSRLDKALNPDFVVDQAALTLLRRQLEPVAADIDRLPTVAGAVADGPVKFADCSTDNSGGITQPSLEPSWTLVGAARSDDPLVATEAGGAVASSFARQLVAAGWDASAALDPGQQFELRKDQAGYIVTATVTVYGDALYVSADTPLDVCIRNN